MNKRHIMAAIRKKSYLTAGVIALAAVVAMTGINYKNTRKQGKNSELTAQAEDAAQSVELDEEETSEEETLETLAQDDVLAETTDSLTEESQQEILSNVVSQEQTELVQEESATTLQFSEDSKLSWPIQGNVLMEYSMDQTIYFATLDQYKYNPAMMIQGDVNAKVLSAADAEVISIETDAVTGLTVTVDLGNGYQAIYGQLKEVDWEVGDMIPKGQVVGYLAEPSKYFCIEGSNLYFAMTKDGNSINPMDYLE